MTETNIHEDKALPPDPEGDWIDQKTLVSILGDTEHTGSKWAKAGLLSRFEHGFAACGRRRYSLWSVRREQQRRLAQAAREQDERIEHGDT